MAAVKLPLKLTEKMHICVFITGKCKGHVHSLMLY